MPVSYRIFDKLLAQGASFAIYRLPRQEHPVLVMQNDLSHSCLDSLAKLNGQKGFVMAPFAFKPHTPVLLLRPDVVLQGTDNILAHAKKCLGLQTTAHPTETTVKSNDFTVYSQSFQVFLNALHTGAYKKLVLSRAATMPQPTGFSPGLFFQKACQTYPTAFVSFYHTPVSGAWIGSSPEMLLVKRNGTWETVALAGTMPLKHPNEQVTWDEKNKQEQEMVAQYIRERLAAHAGQIQEKGPYTAIAGAMAHLKTEFSFVLPSGNCIGDLLQTLHPTPAVCGLPKAEAYQFLLAHEGYDRLYYSGFSGYLDPEEHTNLYVNLRCMRIAPGIINLFVGGGLLEASDLHSEWQETEVKMKTMLSVLTS